MLLAQRVYAPDNMEEARWADEHIALGRRLFKLLPEDKFDRGPVVSEDGLRVLVADVRLDNRDELLSSLNISSAEGRQLSDADVLMASLERWEEDAVPRLEGDFAFAHWNSTEQRLMLARDYMGQRPLHYFRNAEFFAFASMPKGLHALVEIPRAPDEDTLIGFLALMPEKGTRSFFDGIERVAPGQVCIVTRTGISSQSYWQPSRKPLRFKRSEDYDQAVREALDRAVTRRLRGCNGSIGTHLSAGLDSGAVTATAALLLAASGRVTAFTSVPREDYAGASPRGRFGDEGALAAKVARLYPNIEHVLVRTSGVSPLAALDRNYFLFERPVLNLCNAVWHDAILDQAKQRRLRVMLTGQFGNMSLSYAGMELLPELLAQGNFVGLARQFLNFPRNGIRIESAIAHTIGPFLPANLWRVINRWRGRHFHLEDYSCVNLQSAAKLRDDAAADGLDFSYRPRRDPFGTRRWVLERADLGNYNKGYLGGWGIDMRDPTADRALVELCLRIPAEEFIHRGLSRALARRALADRLPTEVVTETRKGLQGIDWHEGLSGARDEVLLEVMRIRNSPEAIKVLQKDKLSELLDNWPAANWHNSEVTSLYRLALLRGISGGHFVRKAAGSNA